MLVFSTWYLLQIFYLQKMAFFLLWHKPRFGKQVLPVTKALLNLFIGNLHSIEDTVSIFDLFFWFVYLFAGNTQLTFYI